MGLNHNVFRKVAIERLSSPEQLDTLVRVTSPHVWIILAAIGILLAALLYWGFFGTLTTQVSAEGVLIHPGGLKPVHTRAAGVVSDIRVIEHDIVKRGDTIAWLEQPHLLEQIKQTKLMLASLPADGEAGRDERLLLEQQLEQLMHEYELAAKVKSPYSGKVVDVMAANGQQVGHGSSVVLLETLEEESDELIAVLYVPARQGKQLLPGMNVRVSPASVSREEYGSLVGSIVSVSEFPVTIQGMLATLGNEGLVQQLASQGVALEVRVRLVPDSGTPSGYRWTTAEGPPIRLSSGTLVDAKITVSSARPIGLVIPQWR